ncbi:MAG: FAD-dependent oxidoreductase [Xanthomonadales bacterium]|nr:FAD-dependent oxidoreductase [Xanthomonadales bacterium]
MKKQFDAIIIGSGIIGACTALELSRRGFRTLNIDKEAAAGYGSTANSSAVIRTHYSTFQGTALAWESYHQWKQWSDFVGSADDSGLARYVETGILAIKRDKQEQQKIEALHKELGIPFEIWDTERIRRQFPHFDLRSFWPPKRPDDEQFGVPGDEEIVEALYFPSGGFVNDPILAVHNAQRAAEKEGAAFLFRRGVIEIHHSNGRISGVVTSDGMGFEAPVVINAAGPHSDLVNQMAGVTGDMRIRTRPLRHEVHYTPAPEQPVDGRAGMVVTDDDVGVYSRPETGEKMLIGSLDPACDVAEWVDDPDSCDHEVTRPQWESQVYRLAQRIPELPIPTHPLGVADLYDVSDDWIPIYDKSGLPGFYLAVGTSGSQFKNAPVVGRMMAELVVACEDGRDHDRDPVQVEGRFTDVTIDLAFYSRLRVINRESSFSVLG